MRHADELRAQPFVLSFADPGSALHATAQEYFYRRPELVGHETFRS